MGRWVKFYFYRGRERSRELVILFMVVVYILYSLYGEGFFWLKLSSREVLVVVGEAVSII